MKQRIDDCGAKSTGGIRRVGCACRCLTALVLRNRFLIAIASLVWLIWRSGTQPRRLAYPCQQAAAANLGFLAVLFVPALARRQRAACATVGSRVFQLASGSVVLAGTLFVLISGGVAVWSAYVPPAAVPGEPALIEWPRLNDDDLLDPVMWPSPIDAPNGETALVAVNRNDAVTYGSLPYGPGTNTAYDLVRQTVTDLQVGPAGNPLGNITSDINNDSKISVVLKPNWVEYYPVRAGGEGDAEGRSPAYTHPAMMRPMVDMAVAAGATEIVIGDSSGNADNPHVGNMGYIELVDALRTIHPHVDFQLVNFQNKDKFSWVNVDASSGGPSAYADSGYFSDQLAKPYADASYFSATDPHGQAGPTASNCMGWYALTDYLLDADLIINMPKLKVHFMGVNTMAIKNWVGTTMLSTYNNTSGCGSCRISHELATPANNYDRMFGNDIMWREVLDVHRAFLYWMRSEPGGHIATHQVRRYLNVLDAVVCGETDLYYNGGPRHWRANTVVASVDPVALDAVASRIQRYKFDQIPITNNANQPSYWPIGTSDPAKVCIIGDTPIDGTTFGRLSDFDDHYDGVRSWPDWEATTLYDITPPEFVSAAIVADNATGDNLLRAYVENAHVVYFHYETGNPDDPTNIIRLGKNGNVHSAMVSSAVTDGLFVAQDEYFNTTRTGPINAPAIHVEPGFHTHEIYCGENLPSDQIVLQNVGVGLMDFVVDVDADWLDVDVDYGEITDEQMAITITYTVNDLNAGLHETTIRISSTTAANSPLAIPVSVFIDHAISDFDFDCDVDQEDFGHFQACLTGAGVTQADPLCADADMDGDNDVDQSDFGVLQGCMSGANTIPDETCDD